MTEMMQNQEIHTEEKGPMSPFLIPEIVEALMNNIDEELQILIARSVCLLWNKEAINSLRKKIQKNQLQFRESRLTLPFDPHKIEVYKEWECIFEKSKILDILLSNLTLAVLLTDKTKLSESTLIPEDDMFVKYGSIAKKISIYSGSSNKVVNDLGSLVQILTEFCPNIENMKIHNPIENLNVDETAFHFAENQTLLKLKHLQFSSKIWWYESDTLVDKNLHVLLTLLKNSPRLTSLGFESTSTLFWNRFYDGLSTIPTIVLNLNEISLTGNILDLLYLFNDIKFGPNLTKVKFHNKFLHHHFQDDFVSQLQLFMKNVGINLKYLEFEQSKHDHLLMEEMDFNGGPSLTIDDSEVTKFFPQMPFLKKFTSFFKFQSFKFLESMPNLNELRISKFTNKEQMLDRPFPKNRIQELTFIEYDCTRDESSVFQKIFSSDTIKKINLAFPNLIELNLELNPSTVLTNLGLKLWFENICKEISSMEHLKTLAILVCPSDYDLYKENDLWDWYSQVNLEDGFGILKNTPNLQVLALSHALIDSDGFMKGDGRQLPFPKTPLLQLLEAPNLRHLFIAGLLLDTTDDSQSEVDTFLDTFFNRGIEVIMYTGEGEVTLKMAL